MGKYARLNCIGYLRGASDEGCALIDDAAQKHGAFVDGIIRDEPGRFSGWRRVQSLIKLCDCSKVIVPSYEHLGEDEYMRLENALFIERNGAQLICAVHHRKDRRHDVAAAVRRFYSYVTDWDVAYGRALPYRLKNRSFKRVPPIGYRVENGCVLREEREAMAVRTVFEKYCEGSSIKQICDAANEYFDDRTIQNMTVKTILRNERYLGRRSKKGYSLPSLVSYDLWLKAHERLEREYPTEYVCPLTFRRNAAGKQVLFYKGDTVKLAARADSNYIIIDADALECGVTLKLGELYSEAEAEAFFTDYVIPQRDRALNALPEAESEYAKTCDSFREQLELIKSGDRSEMLQESIDILTDRKNMLGMKLRRIRSEAELFSISLDQTKEFFSRTSRFNVLSTEERAFIASALVPSLAMNGGLLYARIVSPGDGRVRKHLLENVIVKQ